MMHLMGYLESEYFPTNRIVGGDYCSNVVKRRFHPICVPLCFLVDPCSSSVKHLKMTDQKKNGSVEETYRPSNISSCVWLIVLFILLFCAAHRVRYDGNLGLDYPRCSEGS